MLKVSKYGPRKRATSETLISKADIVFQRQLKLKELLIRVRNGGMITPVIFEIEQLYGKETD